MKLVIKNQYIILMKYLRKYNEDINFDDKEYKVIIVGIPSGEVFQASYDNLGELFASGTVTYKSYKDTTGFYSFDDENREKVLDVIEPNRKKAQRDVLIKSNMFNKDMLDKLMYLLNDYPYEIEVTIEDYNLMISSGDFLLDILYNDETSPKYLLVKRRRGLIETKYSVSSDDLLVRSIIIEMNK